MRFRRRASLSFGRTDVGEGDAAERAYQSVQGIELDGERGLLDRFLRALEKNEEVRVVRSCLGVPVVQLDRALEASVRRSEIPVDPRLTRRRRELRFGE